jgi:hypothetical protein
MPGQFVIEFDRNDTLGVRQQFFRKRAASRPDLYRKRTPFPAGGFRYPFESFTRDKKMLP